MPPKANLRLSAFRAYLTGDKGLSAASAETYVKHVRRTLNATKDFETLNPTEEKLLAYDGALSVAMRDGFRAAWGHFAEFMRVKFNTAVTQAPSKRAGHAPAAGSQG